MFKSLRRVREILGRDRTVFKQQGWRSGDSARLPPMCPGFDSRARRHMWIEFVVSSRTCSEGFSPGSPVFLPPQLQISTFLNSNSIWKHLDEEPLRGNATANSHLFFYFILYTHA